MSFMIKFIPNLLCFFRIVCAPLFLFFISSDSIFRIPFTLTILLLGAFSDFLDGFIARKFNVESKFGEILDPFADKIFSNTVLWGIYIFNGHPFPILFVAIFLTLRDLFLIFGAAFVFFKNIKIEMKPIYLSKICTVLVFTLSIVSLFLSVKSVIFNMLSYTIIFLIILTFFIYFRRFLKFN